MKKKFIAIAILLIIVCLRFVWASQSDQGRTHITAVSAEEAADLIETHSGNSEFVILDIRTPGEYNSGHLANSILIDFYSNTFADQLSQLDKKKAYLVYCRTGNRSYKSMEIFNKLKFQKVYHMASGIRGWAAQGFSVVR